MALPLGELSPQVTERALSVLAVLVHLSQRERQGGGAISYIAKKTQNHKILSLYFPAEEGT